ncbi:MAG: mandelate racemase [Candidatus Poribacteria bacterium]|nr:mandelate racemase [Candidatus Poribacteria bacterium]
MKDSKIARIEWARLTGQRPRKAGCNSRLGEHGQQVSPPIARITTDDGATGFGSSRLTEEQATTLVGSRLSEAFDSEKGATEQFRVLDYPLWDLAGQLAGKPVYALLGAQTDDDGVFRARCYDTSLYIDDLHLEDEGEAAALIASEALEGAARGHKAFKIKVGRGAMHMPVEAGTRRDIRVIHAVREAVGADAKILLDANNGYNLNLTKRVLGETADVGVYWMEEAFHEDARLYANLKEWLNAQGLETRIADGEGDASRHLLEWAQQGLIDIVQYDIFHPGFTRWCELGPQLDEWNVGSAPHHYGGHYGHYVSCHLAAAIRGFEYVEWDEADTPGLDASEYSIADGHVNVSQLPGFGLKLDEEIYARAVKENGFVVSQS